MEGREDVSNHLVDYDYDLPSSLIAQAPAPRREGSRLLVLHRCENVLEHRRFDDIRRFLGKGDTLVLNDTRVVPARLLGTKDSGGKIEALLLDPYKSDEEGRKEGYSCLVRASKSPRAGSVILLEKGVRAEILSPTIDGKTRVRFLDSRPLLELLAEIGRTPLPPYIRRDNDETPTDRGISVAADAASYQTVYASRPGAVAAPTAGLHFSGSLLDELSRMGVEPVKITLHVGYGTFSPIRVEDIREHRMHSEHVEVSARSAERIEAARREGRRIVAVGTTAVRTLEWIARLGVGPAEYTGPCDHFIFPPYEFRMVDAMITNFHLPKSSLLLLVSAFAGRTNILDAYREAVKMEYRFFSYGDAMLIL